MTSEQHSTHLTEKKITKFYSSFYELAYHGELQKSPNQLESSLQCRFIIVRYNMQDLKIRKKEVLKY